MIYKINGGKELYGSVTIGGSKNACLPIIAAAILIKGKVVLNNVPEIGDVYIFIDILKSMGILVNFANNILSIDSTNVNETEFELEKIKKIRVSILLLPPLLARVGKVNIPMPGGCVIGKRSIDEHLNGLKSIGYNYSIEGENIYLDGKTLDGDIVINAGLGVTPTENLIIANILRKGKTTIKMSAIEPHVMNLVDFVRKAGADIKIRYDHTIIINGVDDLKSDFEFDIVSDYIQSGSYMIIGALAAKDYIDIHNARIEDLYFYMYKMREAGVRIEELPNDTVRVYRCHNIKAVNIQTMIYPGFPTDLQSPFAILMTQADGASKIHEVLFEGRLNRLVELDKMRGHTAILNPHEAMIFGPTKFKGTTVTSRDLRAGCAVVIAGLIADGATAVTSIDYIKRGYDNFLTNLQSLGADISEIDG